MFVDASVIVAVMTREKGYEAYLGRLGVGSGCLISPLTRLEAVLAIARIKAGPGARPDGNLMRTASQEVNDFLGLIQAKNVDLTDDIGDGAVEAAATYGEMVGHKAKLNLGDCFAYACAKAQDVPLLYKGNDFALTDLA